jgi:acyl-CoA hydrolase
MELKGTRTEEILKKALHVELEVGFRYRYFAEQARKCGLIQVADIFESTADNEEEHARHEIEFLDQSVDALHNIEQAISEEAREAAEFYPLAEETARGEGFEAIADYFHTMVKVEESHETNFRELLAGLAKGTTPEGHTVGHSAVVMAQVMLPDQANPAGFVHGGELMKIMDNAAGVVAARHSGGSVVTGEVEDIRFIRPVRVGDLITAKAKLAFVSSSSMEVRIQVEAENLFSAKNGEKVLALSALFVMVALNGEGKPKKVPPMILNTEEEKALFAEGRRRYEQRKKL